MTNAMASPSVCRCRLHTCHAAGEEAAAAMGGTAAGAGLPSPDRGAVLWLHPRAAGAATCDSAALGCWHASGKRGSHGGVLLLPPGPPFCFQTETRPPASLEGGPRERLAPSSGLAHSALGWAGIPPVYAAGDGLLPELPAPSLYPFGSAVKTGWRWGEHGDRNSACVRVWLPFYPELQ